MQHKKRLLLLGSYLYDRTMYSWAKNVRKTNYKEPKDFMVVITLVC